MSWGHNRLRAAFSSWSLRFLLAPPTLPTFPHGCEAATPDGLQQFKALHLPHAAVKGMHQLLQ